MPYHPVLLLKLVALLFLGSFLLTAIEVLLSDRIKQMQSAMPTLQLIITPMMFLSGALFPIANLPGWLSVLTKLNPLTYVVQPMRSAIYSHLDLPAAGTAALGSGIDWWAWQVPAGAQALVALACAMAVLVAAIAAFDHTD